MLVVAESAEEAMRLSEKGFDKLIEMDNGGWDYYTIFNSEIDDPKTRVVSGTARWGEQQNPINFHTVESWELIRSVWDYYRNDFTRAMDKLRRILNTHTSEQIYENLGDWEHKRDGLDKEICYACKNIDYGRCWDIMSLFRHNELEYDVGNNIMFGMEIDTFSDDSEYVDITCLFNDQKLKQWLDGKVAEKVWIVLADMHR